MKLEARAFDKQIRERVSHGHIPDLRRVKPCNWFQNNIWRRPYLVKMMLGRVINFFLQHLPKRPLRILEVGCGPGYISLELARNGFDVLGLDISSEALCIAKQTARTNSFLKDFGNLNYIKADFLDWYPGQETFDAVVFFGSLHHFPNTKKVLNKVAHLLKPKGRILVYEPARDWWTEKDAVFLALIRILLSTSGHWYRHLKPPTKATEFQVYVESCLKEVQEAHEKKNPRQSPMDNPVSGTQILKALRKSFKQIDLQPGTLLFDRIAAGVRFDSERRCQKFAQFINAFELFALSKGFIQPGDFMFAGSLSS